jgi:CubicO group peptidase (beta-lactamase class C family)
MGTLLKTASAILALAALIPTCLGKCSSQSPFFPPPKYTRQSSEIWEVFSSIEASLSHYIKNNTHLNTSSYSIEVTSSQRTLWSTFHTAPEKNLTRPGAEVINETSRYRIASITKVFTVLGILQLHAAGNISLDDPLIKFIPHLQSTDPSAVPWYMVTLRSLASQLAGIPRDWAQGDLLTSVPDPTTFGLPFIPASAPEWSELPDCDSYGHYKPCTAPDLVTNIRPKPPLFAPNQKSTYSNIAFELLGIVISNVTGLSYEDYITTAILQPLNMTQTSFIKPADDVAVLPKGEAWYWDVDEGIQNPTGGLFCSSHDMSLFQRYVLANYTNIAEASLNWLMPVSFTHGMNGFYGMPWEIFRSDKFLDSLASSSQRAVTVYTKGGGLPGYRTLCVLIPEYDLGVTIFTAGGASFINELLERVTVPLIRAADTLGAKQTTERYTGTFSTADLHELNSSVTLSYSSAYGLEVTRWISNSTNMFALIPVAFQFPQDLRFRAQLIPTGRYVDEVNKEGEKWRAAFVFDRNLDEKGVWDDWCITDVDIGIYAGMPLNEIVFWDGEHEVVSDVQLTAFRVNLTRVEGTEEQDRAPEPLLVQDL